MREDYSGILAQRLLSYIDASPSPWHAVASSTQMLLAQGYCALDAATRWQLQPGGRYFVTRGASLVAFVLGCRPPDEQGYRLVVAHTDSPGLRLKPRAAHSVEGMVRLGVEVYGGPILASFADRDLSLAGRVCVRQASGHGYVTRLLRFDTALVRLANLAIHLNREVNEKGLRFDRQTELPLLFAPAQAGMDATQQFDACIAAALDVDSGDLLSWDLNVYDTQPGCCWGPQQEFIASRQLDNLASCHAALSALVSNVQPQATCLCALFDHEEVGSGSASGAAGSLLADVLARLAASQGLDEEARRCAQARSFMVSADMAHAYHANFPAAYEPAHRVQVNAGPVIKSNAGQRYSSDAESCARFMRLCESIEVPVQHYVQRSDLACGSTIGPILAASLGIASVDVGAPLWAMHSVRESAGVRDHAYMLAALSAVYGD